MIRFFAVLSVLIFSLNANAQLFSTKSGVISFSSSTPLEDIYAKTSEVESKLLSTTGQLTFTLLVKGFRFENEMMEEHFNDSYLETGKFPKADFKGTITNFSEIKFTTDGTYPAKVKGNLTIHGITKAVETSGSIIVKGGKPTAKCKFSILLRDYSIGGKMIGKEIAENMSISVDCKYE